MRRIETMERLKVFRELNEMEEGTLEMLTLDIELVLNDTIFTEELEYRELPIEYQLSEEQFARYKDFIMTVVGAIKSRGFQIVDEYQSDESYSYYIQFTPAFYEGTESPVVYDVKLRLSNHPMNNKSSVTQRTPTGRVPVFRSFVVNGVKHTSILPTLNQIVEVLNDLHAGDYDSLIAKDIETSNNMER